MFSVKLPSIVELIHRGMKSFQPNCAVNPHFTIGVWSLGKNSCPSLGGFPKF